MLPHLDHLVTDPLGAVIRYECDVFGHPVLVTDPTGISSHLVRTEASVVAVPLWPSLRPERGEVPAPHGISDDVHREPSSAAVSWSVVTMAQ
ncbi:RHS repeat domain-containing protein [Streptomyces sp. PanSC9]|uniref:RHS repeat domain-containing protein n=1 Tax=Streptomyces sp. PanSC9 TaxID=1520461 RepID=UPI0037D9CA65